MLKMTISEKIRSAIIEHIDSFLYNCGEYLSGDTSGVEIDVLSEGDRDKILDSTSIIDLESDHLSTWLTSSIPIVNEFLDTPLKIIIQLEALDKLNMMDKERGPEEFEEELHLEEFEDAMDYSDIKASTKVGDAWFKMYAKLSEPTVRATEWI
jgi:hypothetical protein